MARLAVPQTAGYLTFLLLGLIELAIPAWAERSGRLTPWHPDHIAERYGLFTIIVLGECVLAATDAVQNALAAGALALPIGTIALGGLVLVFGLWWSYFKVPAAVDRDLSFGRLLAWGYGHYVIFASIAALGAGLQVATDTLHANAALGPEAAAATVAVPVVIYLVALVFIHARPVRAADVGSIVVAAVLLVLTAAAASVIGVPVSILVMGLLVAGLVAVNVVQMQRAARIALP